MTTVKEKSVRLGSRRVPVLLPNRRDPRLHTAAVIISLHIIGITALGFTVSVPQIVSAMVTAGLIDVVLTLRRAGQLVWPASGLLTGSGVGLILRLTGMGPRDYWSWDGWYWFALVAGVAVLTKYVIRFRGQHVFNPSNLALVVAFVVLGSEIVEPLDSWWAPLGFWMVVAYGLIVGGGALITRRLRLIEMALAFWAVLTLGLAVLAVSGHCMTTSWSPTPVCDARFWTVLVTSPEVLIFLFFMITDPKTVPLGRWARVAFAASLAVLATFLIAPQTVEFGAKVGLLGSLVLWTPLRGVFDRLAATEGPAMAGRRPGVLTAFMSGTRVQIFGRGATAGAAVVLLVAGVVVAGIPAREPVAVAAELPNAGEVVAIDASDLPDVEVSSSSGVDIDLDETLAASLAVTLAENLATEAEAMRLADGSMLGAVDAGERLAEMQARLDEAIATGERPAEEYQFESLVLSPFETGGQAGAALAFEGVGIVTHVVYEPGGSEVSRRDTAFESVFILSQVAGDRWLLVDVDP
ncbi:MAG: hypothetical protein PVG83_12150 [Acidimicrobiia bacterium]|jgi:hypothetical protein